MALTTPEVRHLMRGGKSQCCYYCSLPAQNIAKARDLGITKGTSNWFQIDRKDPAGGYVLENCVPACHACNSIKSYVLLPHEMQNIAAAYVRPRLIANGLVPRCTFRGIPIEYDGQG